MENKTATVTVTARGLEHEAIGTYKAGLTRTAARRLGKRLAARALREQIVLAYESEIETFAESHFTGADFASIEEIKE